MEVNSGNPVTMAFTSHDVLARFHVPDFPGAVIRGSRDNLLPLMECHATNAPRMGNNLI